MRNNALKRSVQNLQCYNPNFLAKNNAKRPIPKITMLSAKISTPNTLFRSYLFDSL